jgi:hypothetical protein
MSKLKLKNTSGTRDLRTPMATPLQPPRTRSGPDRRCASIKIVVCTFRLSVQVFIPLPDVRKPDVRKPNTPVLTF